MQKIGYLERVKLIIYKNTKETKRPLLAPLDFLKLNNKV